MLTGELPFEGEQGASLLYSIVHKTPKPIKELIPSLSDELDKVVSKALAKSLDERYKNVDALLDDLKSIAKGMKIEGIKERPRKVSLPRVRRALIYAGIVGVILILTVIALNLLTGRHEVIDSIAVLPLENLSGDPEQEYFVDGMTDALISQLSQIGALRVISRTSIMMYKGVRKPLPEIARELNVDAIVEGTVVRVGERVRITAKLIEAAAERNLWTRDYERNLGDILELQKDVAKDVAKEISVTLTSEEKVRLSNVHNVNPKAHDAYLRGMHLRNNYAFEKAVEYFNKAIEMDETYALAYAGLADTYGTAPGGGFFSPKYGYPKAKASAKKAIELDDTLAEPHAILGWVNLVYDLDWEGAEREIRRALELNPSSAFAHRINAQYQAAMGRHKKAIAASKQALEIDPISLGINWNLGKVFYLARQYDKAIEQFEKTIELYPNFTHSYSYLGSSYLHKSMFEEAMAIWPKSGPYCGASVAITHAMAGRREEALSMVGEITEEWGVRIPFFLVILYANLGEKDMAFVWLKKSYEERDSFIFLLKVEPFFDPLRSDPRFQSFLRRMNLSE